MDITIYVNPRCSKSRQTLVLLKEKNVALKVIEYLKDPPDENELKQILQKLGIGPRDLLRIKEAKQIGIDKLDGDQLISKMVLNSKVIERPIVISGNRAVIGRPPENVLEIL